MAILLKASGSWTNSYKATSSTATETPTKESSRSSTVTDTALTITPTNPNTVATGKTTKRPAREKSSTSTAMSIKGRWQTTTAKGAKASTSGKPARRSLLSSATIHQSEERSGCLHRESPSSTSSNDFHRLLRSFVIHCFPSTSRKLLRVKGWIRL